MSEYEIISLFANGFGFGSIFIVLLLIYWGQK